MTEASARTLISPTLTERIRQHFQRPGCAGIFPLGREIIDALEHKDTVLAAMIEGIREAEPHVLVASAEVTRLRMLLVRAHTHLLLGTDEGRRAMAELIEQALANSPEGTALLCQQHAKELPAAGESGAAERT